MKDSSAKKGNSQKLVLAAASFAIVGTVASLITVGGLNASTSLTPVKAVTNVSTPSPMAQPILNTPVNVADIVEKVGKAVVSIEVVQSVSPAGPDQSQRPFDEFFKRFGLPEIQPEHKSHPGPKSGGHQARSVGSGFIIQKDGLIVTNNHVIDNGEKITIVMADGRKYSAKVIGADPKTDLALLKIEAEKPLPAVQFGRSDTMRVGDWVVTIGNPFGLGQTVTTGIVSARHRNIGAGPFDDFLQIDAPINKGNSGGPTFNLKGEVIGVNTAIFSPSGGNVGIGFAIPSLQAKRIIADLNTKGVVERGWLGVHIQEVTEEIAHGLEMDQAQGALVSKVTPGGPAANSGLKQGDVILDVNGGATKKMRELPKQIAALRAGDKAELKIWRQGQAKSLTVTIGKTPTNGKLAQADSPKKEGDILGMRLARLDDQMRRALQLEDKQSGVVVVEVEADSIAAKAGLRRGDLISTIGNSEVATPSEAARQIKRAQRSNRRAVLLYVTRGNAERFVAVPLRDA